MFDFTPQILYTYHCQRCGVLSQSRLASTWSCGVVVNMPACQAGDRGFKSRQLRQHATVAQLVEQRTENPRVAGSIPARGTN